MEEELQSHVQLRADALERAGLQRAEAQRRARIEFGSHVRFKEECREAMAGTPLIKRFRMSASASARFGKRRDFHWSQ